MSTAEEGCCRPPTRWPFSDQTGWLREWGGRRGRLWGSKREPGMSVCKAQRGRLWGEGEEQLGTGTARLRLILRRERLDPLCVQWTNVGSGEGTGDGSEQRDSGRQRQAREPVSDRRTRDRRWGRPAGPSAATPTSKAQPGGGRRPAQPCVTAGHAGAAGSTRAAPPATASQNGLERTRELSAHPKSA